MAINKLPEFAKDGQKNTDDLVLTDGFPVLKKPARQWFNWLFNILSLKTNEVIDELDKKLSKTSNLSDLQSASAARTNLGLGTAATANITTSTTDNTVGRILRVGDGGVIEPIGLYNTQNLNNPEFHKNASWFTTGTTTNGWTNGIFQTWKGNATRFAQLGFNDQGAAFVRSGLNIANGATWHAIRTTGNTTVDANGFLKNASPIVQLFADKIELNDEAKQQNIEFEKLDIGDYLIKNSTGLSNDGWYIEQPKDANGNVYHAVVYEQLENGDISVKTFEQKLEGTRIVADLEKPVDIKENRFISIRLNELPQDTIAPQNPNVVDSEGNPAPSKYHYLENGTWKITAEDEVTLENERYAAYQASLRPLTCRQFKLALLENGLLDQIENSISAIEDDQTRARIQIEYTEATEFHRTSDSVMYMCQLLNLTDDQVDQMWEQALTL